jgi:hypothetical protein
MYKSIATAALLFLTTVYDASSQVTANGSIADAELQKFADLLAGSFSSKEQSVKDTAYFDIRLSMTRIWQDRTDGIWLYVEQALASKTDKPYRQRVYRLAHPSRRVFTSEIYTIKDPQDYTGLQGDPKKAVSLTSDRIELKDGCSVTLKKKGAVYTGGTEADHCPSDLRGASYATTKITLTTGKLVSWDQGFDANGKQVWGATKGGYVFLKDR